MGAMGAAAGAARGAAAGAGAAGLGAAAGAPALAIASTRPLASKALAAATIVNRNLSISSLVFNKMVNSLGFKLKCEWRLSSTACNTCHQLELAFGSTHWPLYIMFPQKRLMSNLTKFVAIPMTCTLLYSSVSSLRKLACPRYLGTKSH
jgi:cytochrome c peroxidase